MYKRGCPSLYNVTPSFERTLESPEEKDALVSKQHALLDGAQILSKMSCDANMLSESEPNFPSLAEVVAIDRHLSESSESLTLDPALGELHQALSRQPEPKKKRHALVEWIRQARGAVVPQDSCGHPKCSTMPAFESPPKKRQAPSPMEVPGVQSEAATPLPQTQDTPSRATPLAQAQGTPSRAAAIAGDTPTRRDYMVSRRVELASPAAVACSPSMAKLCYAENEPTRNN